MAYANYVADEAHRMEEAEVRYERDLRRNLPSGARVLEVGCATGSLLSVLRRHGCDVMGVDLSPRFAEAAKRLYGLDVIVGDVRGVPLPRGYFDAALLFGAISNLQDLPGCLVRFREVLRPGGLLVFNYPDASSPVVRWFYRSRHWMFTPSVNCFMTLQGCSAALRWSGFKVLGTARDWQQPSLRKLFHHAKLDRALRLLTALGLEGARVPIAVPTPGVRLVKSRAGELS